MTPAGLALIAVIAAATIVVVVRFEMFCLNELASAEDDELRYLTRRAWAVAIVISIPFGGVAYLLLGRSLR
jgi:hypothetical protein